MGFVGWRGMVGSCLLARMRQQGDFSSAWDAHFFSTSQAGQKGPDGSALADANDLSSLAAMDMVVCCQGGDYSSAVHPALRSDGWDGYWIDAASTLRMEDSSIIVLDPLNAAAMESGLRRGVRDFIGGNCTVSLLLLALSGLLRDDLIEWVSTMTYQAVSGAGAAAMVELMGQMGALAAAGTRQDALAMEKAARDAMAKVPRAQLGQALAGSLLPWVDSDLGNGQSREEWKASAEAARILGRPLEVDGICVRVATLRCHAQALTIKLRRPMDLDEVASRLQSGGPYITVADNDKVATLAKLTPEAVSGSLDIVIGRLRKMCMGDTYISAFTVGDQLLWGAAEPLRRALRLILQWCMR